MFFPLHSTNPQNLFFFLFLFLFLFSSSFLSFPRTQPGPIVFPKTFPRFWWRWWRWFSEGISRYPEGGRLTCFFFLFFFCLFSFCFVFFFFFFFFSFFFFFFFFFLFVCFLFFLQGISLGFSHLKVGIFIIALAFELQKPG